MQDNNKYLFPHPENSNENFIFKNQNFENQTNKDEKRKVLEFSENQEGWTDELTEMAHLHIDANHPIDFASRETCIEFLNQFDQSKKKVVLEIGCSNGNLIKNIIKLKNAPFKRSKKVKSASKKEIQSMLRLCIQNLDEINFFRPKEKKPKMLENLRNIFYKMDLSDKETRILSGVFSSLGKKR